MKNQKAPSSKSVASNKNMHNSSSKSANSSTKSGSASSQKNKGANQKSSKVWDDDEE